ncbi:uncharacterized protein LOC122366303 [Amphibalanus amphitrite]|uniref:uncharacterized protein LOC122366303 n=1 Tax=Amphibalanus amphitrite TaxID=1232801 RepID=UPI001C91178A|nr:uncharacterized protein LOC122366303 [Amphibalanus amphitrite]XP_043194347.1 uncharacterized protein LOC122366303 [Amphibalanus amphitrite]XP_043194348.1 uncharacterized protein LOC122366303 [Amphibalanus amphitrite]
MKLAVKQPSESMPNILNEEGSDSMPATDVDQAQQDEENEEAGGEEDEDAPMTVPADVSCIVPGCGRRHGRMCTFPVDGEMKTAWTSVLEAVFPALDVNAPEPKLKLLCEDHFESTDFDERGLIQPAAVPTRFPGGVKVIYNSSGDAEQPPEEAEAEEPPEPPPITCCVPGCKTEGPKDSMFEFPEDLHRAWCSIITAATSKQSWRKGELDPKTKRPLEMRVCKEHFMADNFTEDKKLKPGSHPSLFDGGKKKVILRPSPAVPPTPKPKPKTHGNARKPMTPKVPKESSGKKLGPVFVNVTDDGLQLLHKSGTAVPLSDLTLAELRRIHECLKDKLRGEPTEDEKRNLEKCVTQVKPVLEEKELSDAQDPDNSPVLADVMALNPDMHDVDVRRLVDSIKQVDSQRREYERSLSRFFEDSDSYARESEGLTLRINTLKRKISAMETTFLRFFKYNDQRRALMGASTVKWAVPTLTMARDIIQKVGKTAYGRILRMGFPLPSAEVVAASMERASAGNVQWGLVDVLENRATGEPQSIQPVPIPQNGTTETRTEGEPAAKKAKTSGSGEAATTGDSGALQGITAEHLQNVLAGKGSLVDSKGRVIKVSLADVPGAPPGAKTVVMETPDDAGEVRYVPAEEAGSAADEEAADDVEPAAETAEGTTDEGEAAETTET